MPDGLILMLIRRFMSVIALIVMRRKILSLPGIIFLLMLADVSAEPTVTFVPNKEQVKEIVLENSSYKYTIAIDNAV